MLLAIKGRVGKLVKSRVKINERKPLTIGLLFGIILEGCLGARVLALDAR